MASLLDNLDFWEGNEEFYKEPLSLSFTLGDLVNRADPTYYAVSYELILKNSALDFELSYKAHMLEQDIEGLLVGLANSLNKQFLFGPLEGDFTLSVELREVDNNQAYLVTCFVDEANRQNAGIGSSGTGIRLLVNEQELKKFSDDLHEELSKAKTVKSS